MSEKTISRRVAVNRLVVDGKVIRQCVVELDGKGHVCKYYPFTEELPFTEWLGGKARIENIGEAKVFVREF